MAYSLERNKGKVSDIKQNIDTKKSELKNLEENKENLLEAGREVQRSEIDEDVQKTLMDQINQALEANAEKGDELADDMNVDAKDLENMKQEMQLVPMEEFMEGACTKDVLEKTRERGMQVLTNAKGCYGAGMILNPDIQKQVSDQMKGDYYVLPSSIHEVLIVPDLPETDLEDLSEEVKLANDRVEEEDLLSYQVQHYSAAAQILENACQYQRNVKADPQKYGKESNETERCRAGMVRG